MHLFYHSTKQAQLRAAYRLGRLNSIDDEIATSVFLNRHVLCIFETIISVVKAKGTRLSILFPSCMW